MISTANLIILLACVSIFSLRAYKLGIWQALFNLSAWLGAYICTIFIAPYLIKWISPDDIRGGLALLASMLAIFFLLMNVIAHGPKLFFPVLRDIQSKHRTAGAIFGALNGCLLAFVLIWLSTFVTAFLQKKEASSTVSEKGDKIGQMVSNTFGKVVKMGMQASGSEGMKAAAVAAAISQPQQASRALSQVSQKEFWRDQEIQSLLMNSEIDRLMQHNRFQSFAAQPDLAQLLRASVPKGSSERETQRYLASEMSSVFRRIQTLRTDSRFQEIVNDPEVKSLLEAKNPNPIAMITHPKFQALMGLVFEEARDNETIPNEAKGPQTGHSHTASQYQGGRDDKIQKNLTPQTLSTPAPPEVEIYRWTDENGRVRYTDFMNTPANMRKAENRM